MSTRVVVSLLFLLLGGCEVIDVIDRLTEDYNLKTPGSGIRVKSDYDVDLNRIDREYNEVIDCWQNRTGKKYQGIEMNIVILPPVMVDGVEKIEFNGRLIQGHASYTEFAGHLIDATVYLPPGMKALRHEFSHIVGTEMLGKMPHNGYGACWV